MTKIIIALIIFIMSSSVFATMDDYQNAINDISSQIVAINQEISQENLNNKMAANVTDANDRMHQVWERIINKMHDLKIKYESNPYIFISGFSISLGISPSVNVSIQFKQAH